jgi:cytochrome b involved in lipid metabolism
MTRKLYIVSTTLFWLVVFGLGMTSALWNPVEKGDVQAQAKTITLAELAKHAAPGNCWMAIRGSVYDLSAYLPAHPSPPEIVLPWCGKEATEAYNTKTKGRPHAPYADELLAKYRIGTLAKAP